jgi:hypothetical protein
VRVTLQWHHYARVWVITSASTLPPPCEASLSWRMSDFRFNNLLGAPYRGGTLLLQDNWLFSPVGNRVTRVRARPGGA